MSRILGIELRRSAALGTLAILLTIAAVMLYSATQGWSEGWNGLSLAIRDNLMLIWPLALAAGAWQGRREHRAGVGELFTTVPRPYARRMLPVLIAMSVAAVTAYVLTIAVAAPWIAGSSSYLPAEAVVATLVGVLALVAAVALGLGVGRLLPYLATAPALAVAAAAYVLFGLFRFTGELAWIGAALTPLSGIFQMYDFQVVDLRVSAAQAVAMLALAVTGGILFLIRGRLALVALIPLILGTGLALAVVPTDEDILDGPIDPAAQALVCTDDAPKVCVSRVHAGVLDDLVPHARKAVELLSRLPQAPATVAEDTHIYTELETPRPRADTLTVQIEIDKRGGLAYPGSLLPMMLDGAGVSTVACGGSQGTAVARAAAFYLLGQEPLSAEKYVPHTTYESPEANEEAVKLWKGLRALPEADALAKVGAVRTASLACQDTDGLLS
ncbi:MULTISPECIES: hypothetical protein [Actinoplanes]|uniref:hypothetical protein n=1 Tax=Actinoplanes TaxID=1865 RepID=UPI0005F2B515|nr:MULTISPECIES: hypothetical protein [Actinoplanes]GLX99957.1 hypothetical protein Acsp01_03370 [Actinoplanes sp. NBRC 101535]